VEASGLRITSVVGTRETVAAAPDPTELDREAAEILATDFLVAPIDGADVVVVTDTRRHRALVDATLGGLAARDDALGVRVLVAERWVLVDDLARLNAPVRPLLAHARGVTQVVAAQMRAVGPGVNYRALPMLDRVCTWTVRLDALVVHRRAVVAVDAELSLCPRSRGVEVLLELPALVSLLDLDAMVLRNSWHLGHRLEAGQQKHCYQHSKYRSRNSHEAKSCKCCPAFKPPHVLRAQGRS